MDSVKKAINKFSSNQIPKKKRSKPNSKPEKQITEPAIMGWCASQGWDVSVVESKAVYSKATGRYTNQQAESGMSDLVGNTNSGLAVFIELKAPGRRNSIRDGQHDFLMRKIQSGCFAVCTDSVDHISKIWRMFQIHGDTILMSDLPPKPKSKYKDPDLASL